MPDMASASSQPIQAAANYDVSRLPSLIAADFFALSTESKIALLRQNFQEIKDPSLGQCSSNMLIFISQVQGRDLLGVFLNHETSKIYIKKLVPSNDGVIICTDKNSIKNDTISNYFSHKKAFLFLMKEETGEPKLLTKEQVARILDPSSLINLFNALKNPTLGFNAGRDETEIKNNIEAQNFSSALQRMRQLTNSFTQTIESKYKLLRSKGAQRLDRNQAIQAKNENAAKINALKRPANAVNDAAQTIIRALEELDKM